MNIKCPGCRRKMRVPDEYADRKVKCPQCNCLFKPNVNGLTGIFSKPIEEALPPPRPDFSKFDGIRTDRALLAAMCEYSRAVHNENRYNFLAAYSNAQNALKRDTWHAASFEWTNAHQLLERINKPEAEPLRADARQEFVALASDQLIDFVRDMQNEYERETAHMPAGARRQRMGKIASAFLSMVRGNYENLVEREVVRRVERVADEWGRRAREE